MRLFLNLKLSSVLLMGVLAFSAQGCKTSDSQESDEGSELYGKVGGRHLSEKEVRTTLTQVGFPAKSINRFVCTAWYESNWTTQAINKNKNGSTDFGLLQINSGNWSWCGVSKTTLADPVVNAKCALKIFKSQGLNAWYGYRSNKRKCDSYGGGRLKLTDDVVGNGGQDDLPEELILNGDGSRPEGLSWEVDMAPTNLVGEIPEPEGE